MVKSLSIPLLQTICLSTASLYFSIVMSQNEIPLTPFGRPDLQGCWSNASLTKMERDPAYAEFGLLIPSDKIDEITRNHPQVVRQDTDDNQVWKKLPDGADLSLGRVSDLNCNTSREWSYSIFERRTSVTTKKSS